MSNQISIAVAKNVVQEFSGTEITTRELFKACKEAIASIISSNTTMTNQLDQLSEKVIDIETKQRKNKKHRCI